MLYHYEPAVFECVLPVQEDQYPFGISRTLPQVTMMNETQANARGQTNHRLVGNTTVLSKNLSLRRTSP